jgi:hypothetical protein
LFVCSRDNTITMMFDDGSSVTIAIHPHDHQKLHSKIREARRCCCDSHNIHIAEPETKIQIHPSIDKADVKKVDQVTKSQDSSSSSRYTILEYIKKFQGRHLPTPPYIQLWDALSAFVASFIAIAIVALLQYNAMVDGLHETEKLFIIGSFGATAVLVYGLVEVDVAQPRNVIGGKLVL